MTDYMDANNTQEPDTFHATAAENEAIARNMSEWLSKLKFIDPDEAHKKRVDQKVEELQALLIAEVNKNKGMQALNDAIEEVRHYAELFEDRLSVLRKKIADLKLCSHKNLLGSVLYEDEPFTCVDCGVHIPREKPPVGVSHFKYENYDNSARNLTEEQIDQLLIHGSRNGKDISYVPPAWIKPGVDYFGLVVAHYRGLFPSKETAEKILDGLGSCVAEIQMEFCTHNFLKEPTVTCENCEDGITAINDLQKLFEKFKG